MNQLDFYGITYDRMRTGDPKSGKFTYQLLVRRR